jgi:acetylornithine deacetylase
MDEKRMFDFTKRLVAIPSETGNEKAIGDYIASHLKEIGLKVETQELGGGRKNIYAHLPAVKPRIVFNTHMDTVPPQYGPSEDDEHIYGRGACDTHGILAAEIEAMLDLHGDGVKDIGLLVVCGEEYGHDGAIAAGRHFAEPDAIIVGEPTDNKLASGGKGLAVVEIAAHGVAGHSCYIERYDSAIHKLIDLLHAMKKDVEAVPGDPLLGRTTLNIGLIKGGEAPNIVTPAACATAFYRTTISADAIKKRVEAIFSDFNRKKYHAACPENFSWRWTNLADPLTDVETVPGLKTAVIAFGTDIPFFGWRKARKFLLGPGSVLLAHKPTPKNPIDGEYILKSEMVEAVELYKKLARHLILCKSSLGQGVP